MNLNSSNSNTNLDTSGPEVSGSEKTAQPSRTSFIKDLLSRRVPHILGGYLAGSWIILEFMDWLVRRYPISPHLVEFCLVALAAMIPTVILLAYFHGKPGPDQWTKVEKIGIPTNLVAAAILLVFLFNGRNLGATTTTIILTDEQGQEIERSIPKSEFRKKLAIFSLANESGDSTIDWLMYAIPDMLRYDLSQDLYLDIKSVYDFLDELKNAGYPEAVRIPMTLKKKIAGEQYMDYFTAGTINGQEGQLSIDIFLHDTKTTKLLAKNQFSGKDVFTLVDNISIWLKNGLEIPQQHIDNSEDLPASEILTNSYPALQSLYSGINILSMDDDWTKAVEFIEQSVMEDTTFTYAYVHLAIFYLYNNRIDEYKQAYQPLMMHLYKLPERQQFAIKHDYYYMIKQEPEMALEVAKNWAELYPDDVRAHAVLAILYRFRNQKDNELEAYKKIISLDQKQYDLLLKIARIYRELGEFKEAMNYYQLYSAEFPNNADSYIGIGNLYRIYGEYEQARSNYKKALLIEPDAISTLLLLARIEIELGHFQEALEAYHDIIIMCKNPQERSDVYESLKNYYFLRGQVKKSTEYLDLKITELEDFAPQIYIMDERLESLDQYIMAGKTDFAFQVIQTYEEQLGPPLDKNIPFGYLEIYLELEDIENAEKALGEAEAAITSMQSEMHRSITLNARGRIFELKGEFESAIQSYTKLLDMEPTDAGIHVDLGRCYRMQRENKKAEEHLKKALAIHPFWPEANYEMGLVFADRGKNEDALEYLRKAHLIWEDADPGYKPAIKAREKLAEMEAM